MIFLARRFQNLFQRLLDSVWLVSGILVPKRRGSIAVSTFPDFDDTCLSLVESCENTGHEIVVLTRSRKKVPEKFRDKKFRFVPVRSVLGLWYYHRSEVIFFTHGLFSRFTPNRNQIVINLWHGSPIKRIGLLDGKSISDVPRSDFVLAESEAFRDIIASAFGMNRESVIVHDHPRIDVLRSAKDVRDKFGVKGRRVVAWLPTYRASATGDIRTDGNPRADVLSGSLELRFLDEVLSLDEAVCLIKPHPMAIYDKSLFAELENIWLLEDEDLKECGVSLYEFLSDVDLLVTDVSSVYFDFQSIGRRKIVYFPDREAYELSRGFVRPLDELINDKIIQDFAEYISEIKKVLSEIKSNEIGRCIDNEHHSRSSENLISLSFKLLDRKRERLAYSEKPKN